MIRDCLAAIGAIAVAGSVSLTLVAFVLAYRAAQVRQAMGTRDEEQGT